MRRLLFPSLTALVLVLAACSGELLDPTVTDVIVSPLESTVVVGATGRLSANVIGPGSPSQRVEWSSNNNSVATVSATGLVEAIAPGTAVITAISTFDPTKSGTAIVRVTAAAPPPPPPDPWTNAAQVTAVADSVTPIRSNESVTGTSPDFYRILLPASLSQPLVYVELANVLGGDAVVEVFSAAAPRESVYASRSAAWFGLSDNVLTLEEDEFETAQIVDVSCRGPCIILERERPGQEVNLYVRVSTVGAGTVRYNLHVYDDPYQDPGEPDVSDCQGFAGVQAASLPLSVFEPVFAAIGPGTAAKATKGEVTPSSIIVEPVPEQRYRAALETFGDRDCYEVGQPVSRVALARATANLDINIRADIYSVSTGQLVDTLLVERGRQEDVSGPLGNIRVRVVVYSSNDRAGPSATSNYELFFPAN